MALSTAGVITVSAHAATLLRTDRERLSQSPLRVVAPLAVPLYALACRVPVLSWVVRMVAPLLDAVAYRGTGR